MPESSKPSPPLERLRTITASLALAHLIFLPGWDLAIGGSPRLFLVDDYVGVPIVPPLLTLTLAFALLGLASLWARRTYPRLSGLVWIFLILVAAFSLCRTLIFTTWIRQVPFIATNPIVKIAIPIIWVTGCALPIIWLHLGRYIKASQAVLLIVSPLILILWAQLGFNLIRAHGKHQDRGPVMHDSHRTIWILIFDELDQKLAMESPWSPSLCPEFNQWKKFSLFADQAYPPTNATLTSIPAMISGKQLVRGPTSDDYELSARAASEVAHQAGWNWSDSLFRDMREQGSTIGVIGWCFPYGPFYSQEVDRMRWISPKANALGLSRENSFSNILRTLLVEVSLAPILYSQRNLDSQCRTQAMSVRKVEEHLDDALKGPLPDLMWVHFPVPHSPSALGPHENYIGNLKVADRELARLRERLVQAGRFEEATVIILGDHWFRRSEDPIFTRGAESRWDTRDHRVPFFIKLPNQKTGLIESRGFNTILLRRLVNTLRANLIQTPEEVGSWLSANTPYQESYITKELP